jgi:MinD-like ATPase involved in chromosome partitioning or flagellar assembly
VKKNLPVSTEKLSADSLTANNVLKQRKRPPSTGWRKGLMATTGINLGPSAKELKHVGFEDRVRTEIPGCHRLAVISLKGGVGKTTSAAALGSMFASLRGDRVIAIDANPDRGTLGDKIVPGLAKSTVRDFVSRSPQLDRYSAVREFTAQAESRLEVLVSESDPLASLAFSENDYRIISDILEKFYNLILTDCGTGLLHSAMVGVLAKADQVVIVSSASLDGARSASATLDWLEAHNYGELARESVTVITSVRPQAATVHLDEIINHFARRTRAVVAVPYDPHLAEGGQIDLNLMSKGAYQAYLELAAEIADQFPRLGIAKNGERTF